jgi:hypothetical protein
MPKKKPAEEPTMGTLDEGCMVAGRRRNAMVGMIQRGIVRGTYDPTRPVSQGRWRVCLEDCRRLREQDEQQHANLAAR